MSLLDYLVYVFKPENFSPHGEHFVDTPGLFWTFVVSNLITFFAYTGIPIVLFYFVRKRKDLVFNWVFLFFGAFIVLCGIHHLLHTITFFYPIYGIEAFNDVMMAIVSIGTFFSLLPVLPLAIKLTSPKQLEEANKRLSEEIDNRKKVEERLIRNQEVIKKNQEELITKNAELLKKSDELTTMNKFMVDRELKMTELKKELEDLKSR